jgi:hypothetical protein
MSNHERRLSDRIYEALDLALEREELEVAEHLARALEETLTRFGGAGVVDHRVMPDSMLQAFDRLDRLRHRMTSQ